MKKTLDKLREKAAKLMLSALVIGMLMPTANIYAIDKFSDIDGHWAEDAIVKWVDKDLINGYEDGTFRPNNSITRAEFVVLINSAMGFEDKGTIEFSDVKATDWFYRDLEIAMGAKYIEGLDDGSFGPNDSLTREQAACMVARILKLGESDTMDKAFHDDEDISDWSRGLVNSIVNEGIMQGNPEGEFKPQDDLTRAEALEILDNILAEDYVITEAGTKLVDKTIDGDLIINHSENGGEVFLENVTVNGRVYIRGSESDSVYFKNCDLGKVFVEKEAGIVKTSFEGNTAADELKLRSKANIYLKDKAEIDDVMLYSGAKASTFNLTSETRIENIDIRANDISIRGNGSIGTIYNYGTDNRTHIAPNKVVGDNLYIVSSDDDDEEVNQSIDITSVNAENALTIKFNSSVELKSIKVNDINVNMTEKIEPYAEYNAETKEYIINLANENALSKGEHTLTVAKSGYNTNNTKFNYEGINVESELQNAIDNAAAYDTIVISANIGDADNYGMFNISKPLTIKSANNSKVHGSFVITAENVVIDGLNIENKYADGDPVLGKNAINVYADNTSITNNNITAPASEGADEHYGILVFPKTNENNFVVKGNTLTGYNMISDDKMHISAGIMIAEDFQMNKIPEFAVSDENIKSAKLNNNDEIAGVNTYTGSAYGYVRMGSAVEYAVVLNDAALMNAIANHNQDAVENGIYIVIGKADLTISEDLTLPDLGTIVVENESTLTIQEGVTVTVPSGFKIEVKDGGELIKNGTIIQN